MSLLVIAGSALEKNDGSGVTNQRGRCLRSRQPIMNASEFEILARGLRPRLLRTVRPMLPPDDAEDIVQDTMLKMWSIRNQLGEYRSVEALGTTIARRLALNELRDRHPERYAALEEVVDSTPSPEELMIAHQHGQEVDKVLAALPDAMSTLLKLRHIEGYDNATIAAMLGSSEGAVRTALSRARRRVAEIFARSGLK